MPMTVRAVPTQKRNIHLMTSVRRAAISVALVQLAQLRPVGRIHLIEPFHQLVGDVVAQGLIELP